MFNVLSDYVKYMNLSWMNCVGICTDGAPSMMKVVILAKKQNEEILVTHCFLYHETLGAKTTKNIYNWFWRRQSK
jgi:hypothetical protein